MTAWTALFVTALLPLTSIAESRLGYSWDDPIAKSGVCAPKSPEMVGKLQKLQVGFPSGGYTCRQAGTPYIYNALNNENAVALTRVVNRIDSLGGTASSKLKGLKMISGEGLSIAARHCENKTVYISPDYAKNTTMLAHELGHQVGATYYESYKRYVGQTPCAFSGYATRDNGLGARHEEFAEVFAAYVMNANLLLRFSDSCRSAYQFMHEVVFKGGPAPTCVKPQTDAKVPSVPLPKPDPRKAVTAESAQKGN